MIKFLLDANLSPETATYLAEQGFDSKSVNTEKLGNLTDPEIVLIAKKEKRVIITFDLDFGEIYHEKERGSVGIIVLRLKDQTIENINFVLKKFLSQHLNKLEKNPRSLVIYKKNSVRFIS